MSQLATTIGETRTVSDIPIEEFKTPTLITTYRIHLEQAEEGGYVVTSPDLTALITQGDDEKEAFLNAYEAVDVILNSDEKFILVTDES
jgi:predicted RNase H-like HicB family nuclease